jgi:cytochrome c oxidase subunit 2
MRKPTFYKISILALLLAFFAIELAACGAKDSAAPAASNASQGTGTAKDSTATAAAGKDAAPAKPAAAAPIEVKAEASNFTWKLDKTEFTVGQPIHFNATSTQGVHGFSIVGTDVKIAQVGENDKKDVTWTPDKPGEYTVKCIFMCGSGHSTMMTKITVK